MKTVENRMRTQWSWVNVASHICHARVMLVNRALLILLAQQNIHPHTTWILQCMCDMHMHAGWYLLFWIQQLMVMVHITLWQTKQGSTNIHHLNTSMQYMKMNWYRMVQWYEIILARSGTFQKPSNNYLRNLQGPLHEQQPETVAFPLSGTGSVKRPNCLGFEDALLVWYSVSTLALTPNFSSFVPCVEQDNSKVHEGVQWDAPGVHLA